MEDEGWLGWIPSSLQTSGSTTQVGGRRWSGAWLWHLSRLLAAHFYRLPSRSSKLFSCRGRKGVINLEREVPPPSRIPIGRGRPHLTSGPREDWLPGWGQPQALSRRPPGAARWQVGLLSPVLPPAPPRALVVSRLQGSRAGQARRTRWERDCPELAMKSLKSRLRRQDAPGSASSGAAAATAVSPAARARSGLFALPSRGALSCLEARARSLAFPQRAPLRQPGDSCLCGGSALARRPWGPSLRRPRASPRPFLTLLLLVSELLVLRDQIAPSSSGRVSLLSHTPGASPGTPGACPAPHSRCVPVRLRGG